MRGRACGDQSQAGSIYPRALKACPSLPFNIPTISAPSRSESLSLRMKLSRPPRGSRNRRNPFASVLETRATIIREHTNASFASAPVACSEAPAAVVLSQEPYNFNTRSAGLNPDYALNPVDAVLLSWADEIVVMEPEMTEQIRELLKGVLGGKQIICLNIPDLFSYRDSELMELIRTRYDHAAA
jgi:predicted protein tyrosine phosphatase